MLELDIQIDAFILKVFLVALIHHLQQLDLAGIRCFLQEVIPPVIQIQIRIGPDPMILPFHLASPRSTFRLK